jgi:hypothetical protein
VQLERYLEQFERNGAALTWTDATLVLGDPVRANGGAVAVYDWGLGGPAAVLGRGKVRVLDGTLIGLGLADDAARLAAFREIEGQRPLWVSWTADREIFAGANARADAAAARLGFTRRSLVTLKDRLGRPAIKIFRFVPDPTAPQPPAETGIHYGGPWRRGGFARASSGTLTYSNQPGAAAELRFTGPQVTYVFTKAFNRGWASIQIDGVRREQLDLYAPATEWRQCRSWTGLGPGTHTITVTVTGRSSQRAMGTYVDIDELVPAESVSCAWTGD